MFFEAFFSFQLSILDAASDGVVSTRSNVLEKVVIKAAILRRKRPQNK